MGCVAAAALVAACAAPRRAGDLPSPGAMRAFVAPEAGAEAEVVAANGVPRARNPRARKRMGADDGRLYARVRPGVPGLRSTTAVVRFRGGVVVGVDTMGGSSAPQPTLPGASASGVPATPVEGPRGR